MIQVKLVPGAKDSLSADNTAWINLELARPLNVYVRENNEPLQKIIENIAGIKIVDRDAELIDLVISDNEEDFELNAASYLSFGVIPSDLQGVFEWSEQQSKVIDWERSDLLLQHASLADLLMLKTLNFSQEAALSSIEKKSYEIIAHGEKAPIAIKKHFGDSNRYFFLFHYNQSTFPYKVAFPIMLTNMVNLALVNSGLSERLGDKTGILPELALASNTEYRVSGPAGEQTFKSNAAGLVNGIASPLSGSYIITKGGEKVTEISVSLLSSLETGLTVQDAVNFNEVTVEVTEEEAVTDKPLWPILAVIGFLLLLLEWWFYQKRPGKLRTN